MVLGQNVGNQFTRPRQQQIMIAQAPETPEPSQWVHYELTGDGQSLAKGESGVWILGQMEIDVPVQGFKELLLKISTDAHSGKNTLFLSHARLITADGKEIPAGSDASENIVMPARTGLDYYGGPIKITGIPDAEALPAQPKDSNKPGLLKISLAGKNAVRFKATLGGDFPLGDESDCKKVLSYRSEGTSARFLTVLEPHEKEPMVKSATADGPDTLRVELTDGRVQEITFKNFEGDGHNIAVTIKESKNGGPVRNESTQSGDGNGPHN